MLQLLFITQPMWSANVFWLQKCPALFCTIHQARLFRLFGSHWCQPSPCGLAVPNRPRKGVTTHQWGACMSGPIFFQFRPSTTSDSFMSMVHGCMVPANRQELVHVDVHDFWSSSLILSSWLLRLAFWVTCIVARIVINQHSARTLLHIIHII